MPKAPNVSIYKDATLSLTQCPDGFWLYDRTRGMNLAMRAKDAEAAFVQALHYYQRRLAEVEKAEKELSEKVDSALALFGAERVES